MSLKITITDDTANRLERFWEAEIKSMGKCSYDKTISELLTKVGF
jgi:hypothetical protein